MYTNTDLKKAVIISNSYKEVILNLGLKMNGSSYRKVKKLINEFNIDISHFKSSWNKGMKFPYKVSIEKYLSNEKSITSHNLRLRLISEGIFKHKCYICNLQKWMNEKIPLELDHIDGNHKNNSIDNLRLLCPNCHAQTDNYCGKKNKKPKVINKCKCGSDIHRQSKTCRSCSAKNKYKCVWPEDINLLKMVKEKGYSKIGKFLGVSDNAVRKRLKVKGLI